MEYQEIHYQNEVTVAIFTVDFQFIYFHFKQKHAYVTNL